MTSSATLADVRFYLLPMAVMAIVLAFFATPVLAGSLHFITGPTATVSASSITVAGKIAGIGNADVTATVNGTAAVQCRNPGGNVAPGQNTTFATTVTGLHPENGNLVFSIVSTPDLSGACPNPAWTPEITAAHGTITFSQGGTTVLSGSF